MTCPKCGSAHGPNARFCAICGTPLTSLEEQHVPSKLQGDGSNSTSIPSTGSMVRTKPFDPSKFNFEFLNQHFARDISPEGVVPSYRSTLKFFNGNDSLKWINIEYFHMYADKYRKTSESIMDGSTYVSSNRVDRITAIKRKPITFTNVMADETVTGDAVSLLRVDSNIEKLQGISVGLMVYQYYGELIDGEKFHQIVRPDIQFDANGRYEHKKTHFW